MNRIVTLGLATSLALSAFAAEKPNMIVILADDLGYSDIGCYGGEIETPNLDRLAESGVRFRNFYNTSKCHTSRTALISGQHPFQTAPKGTTMFGDSQIYYGITMGQQAKLAGYSTAAVGKWGINRPRNPVEGGFDRFFGFLGGASNFWNGREYSGSMNWGKPPVFAYYLDSQKLDTVPEGFYATNAITDHALEFIDEAREQRKPFFLYVAYNAPHYPLQAPQADVDKYRDRYRAGWEAVRNQRIEKMRRLGILAPGVEPHGSEGYGLDQWDSLSEEEKDWQDYLMAVYAGMVDNMDQNIGRLVQDLESHGQLDNTLIAFVSDNGACPDTMTPERSAFEMQFTAQDPGSFLTYGGHWAHVSDTPYARFKGSSFEGGIASPGIIHWPKGITVKPGSILATGAHLVDFMPTLIEISGGTRPADFKGIKLKPLVGTSLVPALHGQPLERPMPLYFRFGPGRGLIDGDWKIVSQGRSPFALFNLANDPTERVDVAGKNPEVLERLEKSWLHIARDVEQLPAEWTKPNDEKFRKYLTEFRFFQLRQGDQRIKLPTEGNGD